MPYYPSVSQNVNSTFTVRESTRTDAAVNGSPHIRNFHNADYYDITLMHVGITDAERVLILDYWTHNKTSATHTVTHQGTLATYTCVMTSKPQDVKREGLWDVTSQFTGSID